MINGVFLLSASGILSIWRSVYSFFLWSNSLRVWDRDGVFVLVTGKNGGYLLRWVLLSLEGTTTEMVHNEDWCISRSPNKA